MNTTTPNSASTRRDFLKTTTLAAATLAAPAILPAGDAMSLSGLYVASTPRSARAPSTQSSRNAYERSKLSPSTSDPGTYSE